VQQQSSRSSILYQLDASPEQLTAIVKQIGESPDSFSVPKIEPAAATRLATGVGAQNLVPSGANTYAGNQSLGGSGGLGGYGGGMGGGPVQQRALAYGGTGLPHKQSESVQPPAVQAPAAAPAPPISPAKPSVAAAATAKQHVVFVLNIVDHLPSATGARQAAPLPAKVAPASVAPAPAKP
jgi:hypothetical protein